MGEGFYENPLLLILTLYIATLWFSLNNNLTMLSRKIMGIHIWRGMQFHGVTRISISVYYFFVFLRFCLTHDSFSEEWRDSWMEFSISKELTPPSIAIATPKASERLTHINPFVLVFFDVHLYSHLTCGESQGSL